MATTRLPPSSRRRSPPRRWLRGPEPAKAAQPSLDGLPAGLQLRDLDAGWRRGNPAAATLPLGRRCRRGRRGRDGDGRAITSVRAAARDGWHPDTLALAQQPAQDHPDLVQPGPLLVYGGNPPTHQLSGVPAGAALPVEDLEQLPDLVESQLRPLCTLDEPEALESGLVVVAVTGLGPPGLGQQAQTP